MVMVARARTVAITGMDAVPVTVEAHLAGGLPGMALLGASGSAAAQACDRVRAAIGSAEIALPQRKLLVSLAPAEVLKSGARFDLAVAAAVLAEVGELPAPLGWVAGPDGGAFDEAWTLLGEVGLDGTVRPVRGVLPAVARVTRDARAVRRNATVLVPDRNAREAALVDGARVVPIADLDELLRVARGDAQPRSVADVRVPAGARQAPRAEDLADVRGQVEARRALEIAAAGGHHLLLLGPPGCGKSMLARRLPGILPQLTTSEALEVAGVRSVAGQLYAGSPLDRTPPFQAPHHGSSMAALLGGGTGVPRPGVVSLAHRGVLFLDELFEWPRGLLEALREPLEEGCIRVARSRAIVTYPARVQVVAAANPCPCGGGPRCVCHDEAVWRYRSRLSGPIADRLDLAPSLAPVSADDLVGAPAGEPSALVAARVARARSAMRDRWGSAVATNAEAPAKLVRTTTSARALAVLAAAVERGRLTGRGFDRALRVARTCADLDGRSTIAVDDVHEALAHRTALRPAAAMAQAGS